MRTGRTVVVTGAAGGMGAIFAQRTALMCRAMLPLMLGRRWGRIVTIGSASVYSGVDRQSPYVAAKFGVIGLSRSLAREFSSQGITVNVEAPGVTVTETARETLPEDVQNLAIKAAASSGKRKSAISPGPCCSLPLPTRTSSPDKRRLSVVEVR